MCKCQGQNQLGNMSVPGWVSPEAPGWGITDDSGFIGYSSNPWVGGAIEPIDEPLSAPGYTSTKVRTTGSVVPVGAQTPVTTTATTTTTPLTALPEEHKIFGIDASYFLIGGGILAAVWVLKK